MWIIPISIHRNIVMYLDVLYQQPDHAMLLQYQSHGWLRISLDSMSPNPPWPHSFAQDLPSTQLRPRCWWWCFSPFWVGGQTCVSSLHLFALRRFSSISQVGGTHLITNQKFARHMFVETVLLTNVIPVSPTNSDLWVLLTQHANRGGVSKQYIQYLLWNEDQPIGLCLKPKGLKR